MKLFSHFYILIILNIIFLIIILFPQPSKGYWGEEGNCEDYHGITYIDVPYDRNATVILDGNSNESFWSDPKNYNGFKNIPLASDSSSGSPSLKIYMNLTIIINDYEIIILAQWLDDTTLPSIGKDGLYFCWNINCPNFSANFVSTMATAQFGGGYVDGWGWESNSEPSDNCFDDLGRHKFPTDLDDVEAKFTYQPGYSYTVEIKRKLNTVQLYDVQFTENKIYKFNMAIVDDTPGVYHAVSWTYALDMRNDLVDGKENDNDEEDNDEKLKRINGFIVTILIISVISIIFILSNKYKESIKKFYGY